MRKRRTFEQTLEDFEFAAQELALADAIEAEADRRSEYERRLTTARRAVLKAYRLAGKECGSMEPALRATR